MNQLYRYILFAFVLAGGAGWLFMQEPDFVSEEVAETEKWVFPGLDVASIHTIVVTNAYGKLTIEKQGDLWVILEREHYQANTLRMNEILSALSELSIVQDMEVEASRWGAIGVQEPVEGVVEGAGCRVDLIGGDGYQRSIVAGSLQTSGSEAALMFGDEFDGRSFVRIAETDQVYLVGQSLSFFNTIPSDWMLNILSNPHAYKSITYVDQGEHMWRMARKSRDEPYLLYRDAATPGARLPNLSVNVDYSFASMFIRDVLPKAFDRSSVDVGLDHYFELEGLDGFTQRIYLGGKTKAPAQELKADAGSTGVFRKVRGSAYRYVYLDWADVRSVPAADEPPYAHLTYLVDCPQMDDFMISYEEMLVFERMSPGSGQ